MAQKQWTIPVILRELRRVVWEQGGPDIMGEDAEDYTVAVMVENLTKHHMDKQMEIPGQTSLVTFAEKKDKSTNVPSEK